MAELLVQSESLTNIANSIRKVREGDSFSFAIDPTLVLKDASATEFGELRAQLTIQYWEYFDEGGQLFQESGGSDASCIYQYFGFKKREDNGRTVPVLYAQLHDQESEDDGLIYDWEPFYYEGQATIADKTYDKWRSIEIDGDLSWDGLGRKYMYTDVIVVSSDKLTLTQMPEAIEGIVEAVTSDATAQAEDILDGKTAWIGGERVKGNIPLLDLDDYKLTISINTDEQKIQSTLTYPKGYNEKDGGKTLSKKIPMQGATLITPLATSQIAVPAGTYTTGDVTISGNINLIRENIKKGVTIFGVEGIYDNYQNGYDVGLRVGESMMQYYTIPYLRQSFSSSFREQDDTFYEVQDLLTSEGVENVGDWESHSWELKDLFSSYSEITGDNSSEVVGYITNKNPYFWLHALVRASNGTAADTIKITAPPNSTTSGYFDFYAGEISGSDTIDLYLWGMRYSINGV